MKILVNLEEKDEDARRLATHTLTAIEIKTATIAPYNNKDLLCIDFDNNTITINLFNKPNRENVLRMLFTAGYFDLSGFPSTIIDKDEIVEKYREAFDRLDNEDNEDYE